jgi:hypothetical protein
VLSEFRPCQFRPCRANNPRFYSHSRPPANSAFELAEASRHTITIPAAVHAVLNSQTAKQPKGISNKGDAFKTEKVRRRRQRRRRCWRRCWRWLMRYVLPALPVSGPRGNRARRREAARLAQRQGAARCGRLLRRLILQSSFALAYERTSFWQTQLCSLTKQQATELQQEFCTHHNIAE